MGGKACERRFLEEYFGPPPLIVALSIFQQYQAIREAILRHAEQSAGLPEAFHDGASPSIIVKVMVDPIVEAGADGVVRRLGCQEAT